MTPSRVAVLIDAENMPGDLAGAVLREAATHGSTVTRRAYGDFANGHGGSWLAAAAPHAIDVVQVSSPAKGKNASDIRMTIDAMELLSANRADTFCLASCDGDFTPLAIHLRGAGKRVVGAGFENASALFRQSCDIFVVLRQQEKATAGLAAVAKAQVQSIQVSPDLRSLLSLLRTTVQASGKDMAGGWVSLGKLGSALRAGDPQFALKSRGFGSLKTILMKEPAFELKSADGGSVRVKPGVSLLSA